METQLSSFWPKFLRGFAAPPSTCRPQQGEQIPEGTRVNSSVQKGTEATSRSGRKKVHNFIIVEHVRRLDCTIHFDAFHFLRYFFKCLAKISRSVGKKKKSTADIQEKDARLSGLQLGRIGLPSLLLRSSLFISSLLHKIRTQSNHEVIVPVTMSNLSGKPRERHKKKMRVCPRKRWKKMYLIRIAAETHRNIIIIVEDAYNSGEKWFQQRISIDETKTAVLQIQLPETTKQEAKNNRNRKTSKQKPNYEYHISWSKRAVRMLSSISRLKKKKNIR